MSVQRTSIARPHRRVTAPGATVAHHFCLAAGRVVAFRVDIESARRRESLRELQQFCRLQRDRIAKRHNRSVAVIQHARRRAAVECGDDGDLELIASRKS
jgi:hypothetical protein